MATTTGWSLAAPLAWAQSAAAAFDDADAQLRLRQASTAAAEAAAAVDRLRQALASERGKVVASDAERDLNRDTIANLEKSLRAAESRQRDTEKALKEAQEARSRGLAGEAERRKLEAARPATPPPAAPAPAPPPPSAPRLQAAVPAPAPLPPLVPLPPNTAGWIADARTGCRIWTSAAEGTTPTWDGPCPNGIANGRGVLQWHRHGQPINLRYEGDRRAGKAWGRGIQTFENGGRYEGEFVEGFRSGRGSFLQANGDRYDGEWQTNKFHGRGTFIWANGSRFDGEWRDNKPNGPGTLKKPEGTYSGTWTNGCFQQGNRRQAINATAKECGFN